jgi:hypothetical protein
LTKTPCLTGPVNLLLNYFSTACARFRAIDAVQIGDDIWVIDAFQKKS